MPPNPVRIAWLPASLTFAGILASWTGLYLLVTGDLRMGYAWILLALLFDVADGAVARARDEVSPFGQQLDGFGDVLIHLLAPAFALALHYGMRGPLDILALGVLLACGIFRLTRFNLIGFLAPPGGARSYPGLPVFCCHLLVVAAFALQRWVPDAAGPVMLALTVLTAFLMTRMFPFPKPRITWPVLVGIGAILVVLIVLP